MNQKSFRVPVELISDPNLPNKDFQYTLQSYYHGPSLITFLIVDTLYLMRIQVLPKIINFKS